MEQSCRSMNSVQSGGRGATAAARTAFMDREFSGSKQPANEQHRCWITTQSMQINILYRIRSKSPIPLRQIALITGDEKRLDQIGTVLIPSIKTPLCSYLTLHSALA